MASSTEALNLSKTSIPIEDAFRTKRSSDKISAKQSVKRRKQGEENSNHPGHNPAARKQEEVSPSSKSEPRSKRRKEENHQNVNETDSIEVDAIVNDKDSQFTGSSCNPPTAISFLNRQRITSLIHETSDLLQNHDQERKPPNSSDKQKSTSSPVGSSSPSSSIANDIARLVNILSTIRDRYPICFPPVCYRWHWLRVITATSLQDLGAYQVILSLNDSELHTLRNQAIQEKDTRVKDDVLQPLIADVTADEFSASSVSVFDAKTIHDSTCGSSAAVEPDPTSKKQVPRISINDDQPSASQSFAASNNNGSDHSPAELCKKPDDHFNDDQSAIGIHTNSESSASSSHCIHLGQSISIQNANESVPSSSSDKFIDALLSPLIAGRVLGDLHFLFYSLSRGSARVSFLRAHSQASAAAEILQQNFAPNKQSAEQRQGDYADRTSLDKILERSCVSTPSGARSPSLVPSNIDVIDPSTLSLYDIAVESRSSQYQRMPLNAESCFVPLSSFCSPSSAASRTQPYKPDVQYPSSSVVIGREASTNNRDVDYHQYQVASADPQPNGDFKNNKNQNNEFVNLVRRAVTLGYWKLDSNPPVLPHQVHPDVLADAFRALNQPERKKPGRKPMSEIQNGLATSSGTDHFAAKARGKRSPPAPKPKSGNKPGPKPKGVRIITTGQSGNHERSQPIKTEQSDVTHSHQQDEIKKERKTTTDSCSHQSDSHTIKSGTPKQSLKLGRITRKRAHQTESTQAERKSSFEDRESPANTADPDTSLYELLDVPSRTASLRSHHKKIKEFLELKTDGKVGVSQSDLLVESFPLPKRRYRKATEDDGMDSNTTMNDREGGETEDQHFIDETIEDMKTTMDIGTEEISGKKIDTEQIEYECDNSFVSERISNVDPTVQYESEHQDLSSSSGVLDNAMTNVLQNEDQNEDQIEELPNDNSSSPFQEKPSGLFISPSSSNSTSVSPTERQHQLITMQGSPTSLSA